MQKIFKPDFDNAFYAGKLTAPELTDFARKDIVETMTKHGYSDFNLSSMYTDLNSDGFRGDDFVVDHDGLHVLFAGCSQTFGVGLYGKDLWSKKLYDKLAETRSLSGYFNISFPSATYLEIFAQIQLYYLKYGVPDILFINLPDPHREYGNTFNGYDYRAKPEMVSDSHLNELTVNFEIATVSQPKEAYVFSWDGDQASSELPARFDPRSQFMHYYNSGNDAGMLAELAFEYCNNNQKAEYKFLHLLAADNSHSGIAFHDAWYRFIYNHFINNTKL